MRKSNIYLWTSSRQWHCSGSTKKRIMCVFVTCLRRITTIKPKYTRFHSLAELRCIHSPHTMMMTWVLRWHICFYITNVIIKAWDILANYKPQSSPVCLYMSLRWVSDVPRGMIWVSSFDRGKTFHVPVALSHAYILNTRCTDGQVIV